MVEGQLYGLLPVLSLCAQVVILFNFKHPTQHLANGGVVVRYEDGLGHGTG